MRYSLDDAWALLGRGQYARAALICEGLLKTDPENPAVLSCKAMSNWSRRYQVTEALADMKLAVKLAPKVGSLHHNYATILASLGKLDEACAEFRTALDLNPLDTQAFYSLSQNMRFMDEDPVVMRMRRAYEQGRLPAPAREFAGYGLAKVYDDLGRPEDAFAYVTEANKLGARPYDLAADQARLAELQSLAETGLFPKTPNSAVTSKAPVFVVGMPRSGTTLVESVLARHPDVFAAGELPFVPEVENTILQRLKARGGVNHGPDFALLDIPEHQYRRWAESLLERVWQMAGNRYPVFTDKLPHNAIRLGLIAKLFPDARVIHVRRNPLDTGLSNFFMRFHAGHGYSNHLDMIGAQFRIVTDSVATWRRTVDIDILDVRYEALVSEAEPEVRRLLDFIGLEFNDKCLRPHRGDRGVMTASQWQVRQPIYGHAVSRWRAYEKWLQPMIAALGGMGWIEAYDRDDKL